MITKGKCFDLLSNPLNSLCKEMYRDQFGELVCGYGALRVNLVMFHLILCFSLSLKSTNKGSA